jgi:hypothetical protein
MSTAKSTLVLMMVGAILGAVVASLVVPPALSWYNATGKIAGDKQIETLCNIPELIHYATRGLLKGQLVGAGIGAVLFGLLGLVRSRRGSPAPSAG